MIRLFAGLGNPGPDYQNTRHNAGFWCLDALAQQLGAHWTFDKNHQAKVARVAVDGQSIWLVQPQTFMNHSGRAVSSVARFYKMLPSDILVAHDDLDIVPGQARLKLGGSHAGHNGLRDIHATLGTDQYWRLRLGIGHPGHKDDVIHWVLQTPSPDHRIAIDQSIGRAVSALSFLLADDMVQATQVIHTHRPPRPKNPKPHDILTQDA